MGIKIEVTGPRGSGKSDFIHTVLVDALREHGKGASFRFEGEEKPSMFLSGPEPIVEIVERNTDDQPR